MHEAVPPRNQPYWNGIFEQPLVLYSIRLKTATHTLWGIEAQSGDEYITPAEYMV
jgi:hypothetical protein